MMGEFQKFATFRATAAAISFSNATPPPFHRPPRDFDERKVLICGIPCRAKFKVFRKFTKFDAASCRSSPGRNGSCAISRAHFPTSPRKHPSAYLTAKLCHRRSIRETNEESLQSLELKKKATSTRILAECARGRDAAFLKTTTRRLLFDSRVVRLVG